MKKLSITLVLLCSFSYCFGQRDFTPDIDSIKQQLAGELKPMQRIKKNLKLISFYKFSHPEVDSLIESSIALAKKKNMKFFLARSIKFRARHKILINAPTEEILHDINLIDSINQSMDHKFLPGWISNLYVHYYLLIGDLENAKINLDSLDRQMHDNKFAERGSYYTLSGMYYQQKKDYKKAMEEYTNALNSYNPGKTFIYNNLARLHLELQNPDRAMAYADKSISFSSVEKNFISRIESEVIKGEVYLTKKDTANALKHFKISEDLRNTGYYTYNYSGIHRLIDIYKIKDPSKVDSLLSDLESYEFLDIYSFLLIEKGIIQFRKSNANRAAELCKQGIEIAIKRLKYQYAVKGCDCLIDVYQKSNDKKNETIYLRKKIELQALVNDEERIMSLARNVTNYESEKEKALVKQAFEKDQEILNERLSKFRLGGFLGLLILCLGAYVLWKLRNKNRKIESQNKVISKALSEKDILLREIHHRVKNNLQLVSSLLTLQGRSIDDVTAQQAINEGKSRVRSMALIHQDLYNRENLTTINVQNYLEKLTSEIFTTYRIDRENVDLTMNIEDIDLDIDTLVPLGLIINELITNCLKYAFPDGRKGELFVGLTQNKEKLILNINDDGIGYDFDQTSDSSFGTTLISALTEQLDGELTRKMNNGTQVTIEFDLPNDN